MLYDDGFVSIEQEIPNKDRVQKDEDGWGKLPTVPQHKEDYGSE